METAEQHARLVLVDSLLDQAGEYLGELRAARELGAARGENARPRWAVAWLAELRLLQEAVKTEIALLAPEGGPEEATRGRRGKVAKTVRGPKGRGRSDPRTGN